MNEARISFAAAIRDNPLLMLFKRRFFRALPWAMGLLILWAGLTIASRSLIDHLYTTIAINGVFISVLMSILDGGITLILRSDFLIILFLISRLSPPQEWVLHGDEWRITFLNREQLVAAFSWFPLILLSIAYTIMAPYFYSGMFTQGWFNIQGETGFVYTILLPGIYAVLAYLEDLTFLACASMIAVGSFLRYDRDISQWLVRSTLTLLLFGIILFTVHNLMNIIFNMIYEILPIEFQLINFWVYLFVSQASIILLEIIAAFFWHRRAKDAAGEWLDRPRTEGLV